MRVSQNLIVLPVVIQTSNAFETSLLGEMIYPLLIPLASDNFYNYQYVFDILNLYYRNKYIYDVSHFREGLDYTLNPKDIFLVFSNPQPSSRCTFFLLSKKLGSGLPLPLYFNITYEFSP